ncbi:MAG: hypothetical protein ABFR33_07385 [Verrucomicrobiota bacterium]
MRSKTRTTGYAIAIIALFLFAGTSRAAVRYWHLGSQIGGDSTDWFDADNWGESGSNLPGVPGAGDHVILHNYSPLTDPVIAGGAAPQVNILTPSWQDGISSTLNIGAGGSIYVNGFTRLSGGHTTTSTVNFSPGAGVTVWAILQMSFNNAAGGDPLPGTEGDSRINLDGGILHLGVLGFFNNGLNSTVIDIGKDGQLLVNGDHTDAGTSNATVWIDSGYLTAMDGSGTVEVSYDATNSRTVFTVQHAPPGTTPANADLMNFVWRLQPSAGDLMSSSITSEFNMYSGNGQMYYAPQNDGSDYLSLHRTYNPSVPDYMPSNDPNEGSGVGYSHDGRMAYLYPDGNRPGTEQVARAYNSGTGDHAIVRPGESLPGYFLEVMSGYAYPRYGEQNESRLELTGGGVVIGSNRSAGGALWSWSHNGKEFVNTRDYGRQIQSAYFDPSYADSAGLFGLINPTEAGSMHTDVSVDVGRRQGSPLVSAQNNGLVQSTRCVPVEWTPQNFGGGPDNPVLWWNMVLGKDIILDYNGMGAVVKYETILVPPADSANSQFEIPTGYLTAEFNRFYTYDAVSQDLNEVFPVGWSMVPVSFAPVSGFGGVIIANATLTHAMGIYGVLRSEGGSVDYFTLWNFTTGTPDFDPYDPNTTKWSAVYGPGSVTGGLEYRFTTWLMSGSLAEVTAFMDALEAGGELGGIVVSAPVLAIQSAGAGQAIISWEPDTPGWVLQETVDLSSLAWTNSPSGSSNPITIPAAIPSTFYRLRKP